MNLGSTEYFARHSILSNCRITAFFTIWAVISSLHAPCGQAADRPPNVVFVFIDDQGYYDLGCYGATEFKTPRIDALAGKGIRFTDYYAAAPICSPSRAGLLTGCYPRRVGNATWVHRADSTSGIHPDELTLAELFQQNGYATACIGKWHLGFAKPLLPLNQGFDHYFGLLHNLDPVEVGYFGEKGVPLLRGREVVRRPVEPAHLTRLYTDEAIAFIRQHKDQPFFLYLPHTMLHKPLGVSDEFKGSSNFGMYGDAIQELDHHVGRLIDSLVEHEIDDQTIVVYASDNGRGPGRTPDQPIRGGKLSTLEGGIRVPAMIAGPSIRSHYICSEVVNAMDWYPTLATLAGIRVPKDRVIDGRDLVPLFTGRTDRIPAARSRGSLNADLPLRRSWNPLGEWKSLVSRQEYINAFFYHGSEGQLAAVRWDKWKLHLNPSLQLYNLDVDPGERTIIRNRQMLRKLRGMAILFQNEMRTGTRPAGETVRAEISQQSDDGM